MHDGSDLAKVQEWLGHAIANTTRVYEHRKIRIGGLAGFQGQLQSSVDVTRAEEIARGINRRRIGVRRLQEIDEWTTT